ncbi:MAG: hypothetical protein Metus_0839 [Candidatus Methanosuratincola subterraneus]|uniref:Yip1 domain-containing protein n=2 Tax=Candidatus Methanosuratincola (ex Vanwonterghem et al. 2016) TaxID=1915412 RepID=A0A444L5L7_METS7|nr:MAG: hypothetical protein Metus_0839 [Candidatus Methanosuratincola subterraneus]
MLMLLGLVALAFIIAALLAMWALVSIPVYLAAKALTGGRASLAGAMVATLFGAIVYSFVAWLGAILFWAFFGAGSQLLGSIVAFLALLWVYKSVFRVGWLQAFGVAVLAIVIMTAIMFLIGAIASIPVFVLRATPPWSGWGIPL